MLDVLMETVLGSNLSAAPHWLAAMICAACAVYVARRAQRTRLAILLPVVLGSMAIWLGAQALMVFGGDASMAHDAASWSVASLSLMIAAAVHLNWQILGRARERKSLLVLMYAVIAFFSFSELWAGAVVSGVRLTNSADHVSYASQFSSFGLFVCAVLVALAASIAVELLLAYKRFSKREYSVELPRELIGLAFCAMLGFFDAFTVFFDSPYYVAWIFLPIYAVLFSRLVERYRAIDLPSADILDQSLAALRDGLLFLDSNGEVVYASPQAEAFLGMAQSEIVGKHVNTLSETMLPPSLVNLWLQVGRPARTKIEIESSNGANSLEVGFRPLAQNGDGKAGFSISLADNSQWSRQSQQWRQSAMRDPLTKLCNRRGFSERLRSALLNSVSESNDNVVVFLLDLDNFKPINDTHGHKAGDEVLQVVGERLRRVVKEEDTVARLGGDEFAIIAMGVKTRAGLGSLLARIQRVFEASIYVGADEVFVGASVGVAVATDANVSADELVDSADRDMYRSKLRNRRRSRPAHSEALAEVEPRQAKSSQSEPVAAELEGVCSISELPEPAASRSGRLSLGLA